MEKHQAERELQEFEAQFVLYTQQEAAAKKIEAEASAAVLKAKEVQANWIKLAADAKTKAAEQIIKSEDLAKKQKEAIDAQRLAIQTELDTALKALHEK